VIKLCLLFLSQHCFVSLGCLRACLLACLIDSSINFFIDGCEGFEIFTYAVFLKTVCFPVFVPISCVGTLFMYSHRSLVSVLFSCIKICDSDIYCAYYSTCHYLTPDSCMLHLFDITYHLPPDILPLNL